AERRTSGDGTGDRLLHLGVRVTQDHRPPRADEVDVLPSVGVHQVRALRAGDEAWCAADGPEGADRRVDTPGDGGLGAVEQRGRGRRVTGVGQGCGRRGHPPIVTTPGRARRTRSARGCGDPRLCGFWTVAPRMTCGFAFLVTWWCRLLSRNLP